MSRGKNRCFSATGGFDTSNCSGITSPPTMWEGLPPEVLEKVMAVLPMQVVCRAQTVCKAWNHVLSQPESAAVRALTPRHALTSVLIAPKWTVHSYPANNPRTEWELLDVAENYSVRNHSPKHHYSRCFHTMYEEFMFDYSGRSYTLPDKFLLDYYSPHADANNSESSSRRFRWARTPHSMRYTLAADGDLVYAIFVAPGGRARVHVVCNPVRKSLQEIPDLPVIKDHYSFEHDIVVMSVQSATGAYKIILMDSYARVHPRYEQVHLFDSTTFAWRTLCELPSKDYYAYSSVVMNHGVLYTLFVDISKVPWRRMLYRCDLTTGAWTSIDAELFQPSHPQDKAQLVVSSGRLFLVEYTGLPLQPVFALSSWESQLAARPTNRKHLIHVSITEIQLATPKLVYQARMLNFAKYNIKMLESLEEMVVAVGCTDSIVVISCLLGRRVAFDLSKNCWHELRLPHPIPIPSGHGNRGVFAALVDF